MKDTFVNLDSVKMWDWYNDGANPNKLEYKTKLWNTTVLLDGRTIFTGDLGLDRLKFLVKLSSEDRLVFTLVGERGIPEYLITMGNIYTISYNLDKDTSNYFLDKQTGNQTYTFGDLTSSLCNFWTPQMLDRLKESKL